jgi:hypothetical protein
MRSTSLPGCGTGIGAALRIVVGESGGCDESICGAFARSRFVISFVQTEQRSTAWAQ